MTVEYAQIRHDLWATAVGWNIDEMCWLALDCDPGLINQLPEDDALRARQMNMSRSILGILDTRYDGTPESRRPTPQDAVDLLQMGGIELPKDLVAAVKRHKTGGEKRRTASGDTKKINTLRRLLITLAVHAYEHKPSRSAAGKISSVAEEHGLPVSEDTVRSHLNEAMIELDQSEKDTLFGR